MAGNEVRVEMGQKDMVDVQMVLGGKRHIHIDVTLRIDDGRGTGLFVGNEVRRVGKTIEVELLQDHVAGSRPDFAKRMRRQAASGPGLPTPAHRAFDQVSHQPHLIDVVAQRTGALDGPVGCAHGGRLVPRPPLYKSLDRA